METNIDTSFSGLQLFPSMLARANESRSAVVVLINSDIMLFNNFSMVLSKVEAEFDKFLMIGARWDVEDLPNSTEEDRRQLRVSTSCGHSCSENWSAPYFWRRRYVGMEQSERSAV
mmetsp:Transcript_3840/g.5432  ORF Transcript_3840/g.5432 Transcript_3840/m.5432 type:complete len:116 (+) Transcript_3840:472-819(+)